MLCNWKNTTVSENSGWSNIYVTLIIILVFIRSLHSFGSKELYSLLYFLDNVDAKFHKD